MTRHPGVKTALAAALLLPLAGPATVWAYDSGSTGADGALDIAADTTLALPPDGVFNYTDVNVAAGATLRFAPNAANTPVTILASGNVNIAGTIDVSGGWGTPTGAAGDGNLGDDGVPGDAGPGGFRGGSGYHATNDPTVRAENGIGPGGGQGGFQRDLSYNYCGGGGGFGTTGSNSRTGSGGPTYSTEALLPLIGGSGGGGGAGGTLFHGGGGGGGGGALLIAASGTVDITGTIYANGGIGGAIAGTGVGGGGGGGSGGAIRIATTTLSGNGGIYAQGARSGSDTTLGHGGSGRVRLEAEAMLRTTGTDPAFTFGTPSSAFVAGMPTLRISAVGGVTAPATPTGDAEITFPADTPNPVTVEIASTGVPVGNTVKVTVIPTNGTATTAVISPALTGSIDAATASVAVDLPVGPSTLMAETTYTIVASLGDTLAPLAGGERVEQVRLAAAMNGPGSVTLITVSGKEYTHPAGKIPWMPAG